MGICSAVVVGEINDGACVDSTHESPPLDLGGLCPEGSTDLNIGVVQCSEKSFLLCFG